MAYTTELTQDCLGIWHTGSGIVTGAELLAASVAGRQLVQNTENFQYEFADFSAVTAVEIEPEELKKIVEEDRLAALRRPHAIVVIVAPSEETHELARRWENQVRDLGWTIHISRDRSEAVQWLREFLKVADFDIPAPVKEGAGKT